MTLKLKGAKAEVLIDEVIDATLEACGEEAPPPKYQGELAFDSNMVNFKGSDDAASVTTDDMLASINHAVKQAMPIRVMLSGPLVRARQHGYIT